MLFALLVWFGVELSAGGGLTGLAERMLAGAQALWPLAVIFTCYRSWPPEATIQRSGTSA